MLSGRHATACLTALTLLLACSDATARQETPPAEPVPFATETGSAEDSTTAAPPSEAPEVSPLQTALDLQQAFAGVARQVLPSVVGISAYYRTSGGEDAERSGWEEASKQGHPGFTRTGLGSGFVMSEDGYLFTAHSVVYDEERRAFADLIEVEIDDQKLPGRLVGAEPTIDFALLKVETPLELRPVTVAPPGRLSVGHWAIAVGDPPGAGTTFAAGTISAQPERECYQEERTATLIQSSARVPPGGWGGPLVDIRGEVIGINLPPPPGRELRAAFGENSDFALPTYLAMTIYKPLLARESRRSPWLGISVHRLPFTHRLPNVAMGRRGILIDDVFDPSPASRAGLQPGDILMRMGREEITTVASFQRWLYLNGIDSEVLLEILRGDELILREAEIGERPASAKMR